MGCDRARKSVRSILCGVDFHQQQSHIDLAACFLQIADNVQITIMLGVDDRFDGFFIRTGGDERFHSFVRIIIRYAGLRRTENGIDYRFVRRMLRIQ